MMPASGMDFLIDLIGKAAGDKRNEPWLEVWASPLYSPHTIATALGLPEDYVSEKLAGHCGRRRTTRGCGAGGFPLPPP